MSVPLVLSWSVPAQAAGGISQYIWIGLIVVVILLLLWWLGRQEARGKKRPPEEVLHPVKMESDAGLPEITPEIPAIEPVPPMSEVGLPVIEEAVPATGAEIPPAMVEAQPVESITGIENPVEQAAETQTPVKPDDLEIIEGIGPKIAGMLNNAGICTFAQLATMPVTDLQRLMLAANLRIADPTTWPEQARLAADGRWTELEKLQNSLKGGRRVV